MQTSGDALRTNWERFPSSKTPTNHTRGVLHLVIDFHYILSIESQAIRIYFFAIFVKEIR